MAIGTPTQRKAANANSQTTTTAFSPASTLAAGTTAILVACARVNKAIASVTDSVGGNTWHVDVTGGDGTRNFSFVSCPVQTQITSAGTITITWSPTTNGDVDYWLLEVTGLATTTPYDVSAHSAGTTTNTVSIGPTATLAQADEIAFAICRSQNASAVWTKGSTWSIPTNGSLGNVTGIEFKIVAATTAVTADATWTLTPSWNGRVATYKGAVAVVDDSVTGVRATATATAQTGFVTEQIVGQRATATAATATGYALIAVTGSRSAATASINAGSVTEVPDVTVGTGSRRLLTGMGV